MRQGRAVPFLVLVVLWGFHAVHNFVWLRDECRIPTREFECFVIVATLPQAWQSLGDYQALTHLMGDLPREPAYPLTAALAERVFGKSLFTARYSNMFWFALILGATFLLGRHVGGTQAGLFSAGLLAFYPAVYGASRRYCVEFAAAGMVALALFHLLKSDRFHDRTHSLLFGTALGLGLMVRRLCGISLAGPLLVVAWGAMSSRRARWHLFFALAVAFLIASPRYLNARVFWDSITAPFNADDFDPMWLHFSTLSWIVRSCVTRQVTWPFFLLFSWGAYASRGAIRKDARSALLYCVIVTLLFFSLIPHYRRAAYFFPVLPAVAVISGVGVIRIRATGARVGTILLAALIGLAQFYSLSFEREASKHFKPRPMDWLIPLYGHSTDLESPCRCRAPFCKDGGMEILSFVAGQEKRNPLVLILEGHPFQLVCVRALLAASNTRIVSRVISAHVTPAEALQYLRRADYVIAESPALVGAVVANMDNVVGGGGHESRGPWAAFAGGRVGWRREIARAARGCLMVRRFGELYLFGRAKSVGATGSGPDATAAVCPVPGTASTKGR